MTDSRCSSGCLFVLDLSGGRVFSLNPDGSGPKTLVTGCRLPDGLAVDSSAGYIYWTNMGVPHRNDGSIERADLDGGNRRFIVPQGGTFTPKQLHLEKKSGKLYWSDREGMRVMRANLDGSRVETLVQTGEGEADRHDPSSSGRGVRDRAPDRSAPAFLRTEAQRRAGSSVYGFGAYRCPRERCARIRSHPHPSGSSTSGLGWDRR